MSAQTTEEKILASAEREFILKGFDATRTTSIAKDAGVTHAMLHYYFRSKENLFEKVISEKMSALGELMLNSLVASDRPLFENISEAITRHLDFIGANPHLPQFFIREVYSHPERMELLAQTIRTNAQISITKLQQQIDEAASRGECRLINAEMLLLDIISLDIFSFLATPVVEKLMPELFADREKFLEERKKENIETIMRKIKI